MTPFWAYALGEAMALYAVLGMMLIELWQTILGAVGLANLLAMIIDSPVRVSIGV